MEPWYGKSACDVTHHAAAPPSKRGSHSTRHAVTKNWAGQSAYGSIYEVRCDAHEAEKHVPMLRGRCTSHVPSHQPTLPSNAALFNYKNTSWTLYCYILFWTLLLCFVLSSPFQSILMIFVSLLLPLFHFSFTWLFSTDLIHSSYHV
jgi:hypothetical protein